MDIFSKFCNICYKTDNVNLRNISEENINNLKDNLITFVGHADIINNNMINLCQLCCQELTRASQFREMCISNLIQLRQRVFDMKSKLELEDDDTCAIQNTLQIFVHQEVLRRNTLDESNSLVSIPTEYETVNSSAGFGENDSVFNRQIQNLKSERNECEFAGDCSDVSLINRLSDCNEFQGGFTKESYGFMKYETESDEDSEFIKEEFDLKNEIENFRLSESGVDVNFDVEMSAVNNSEGIVNAGIEVMKKELHSISEEIDLETITDEFDDGLNVDFEVANVFTIVPTPECGAKSIRIEENAKDAMKLRSRGHKNKSNAATMNAQPNRAHLRKHRNGRSPPKQQSRAHKQEYHGAAPYTCTVCSKSFNAKSQLIIHERKHNGDRPYICTVCNKAFTSSSGLTIHERIHSGDKPYKCTVCNKAFTNSSGLIVHKRTHSGEKPYKCTACNKAFTKSSGLTLHELTHCADRPHKCNVCNKSFSNPYHADRHERTHSVARPYECTICDKAFKDSSILVRHERIHNGDRPYKCTICKKTFLSSSDLTRHERTHSGERPFKCDVCNKTYSDSSHLIRHKRAHSDF